MIKKIAPSFFGIKGVVLGAFALFTLGVALVPSAARADLMIMPIRVLMEDRDRNAELTLVNTTEVTSTYRLEWRHRRMKEVGGYEHLDAPLSPLFNPDDVIKFSPRQVTIAAGETQRIRLSLRKPADLPDGEYRGHLLIKRVAGTAPRSNPAKDGLSVYVGANLGFSIPVVVRQGAYNAGVRIRNPQFFQPEAVGGMPRLTVDLERTGIHSINGHVRVFWTPPGEDERVVGQAKNVNVFHEIDSRLIGVSMRESGITSGQIRIVFESSDGDKSVMHDEQIFAVGQ